MRIFVKNEKLKENIIRDSVKLLKYFLTDYLIYIKLMQKFPALALEQCYGNLKSVYEVYSALYCLCVHIFS